MRHTIVETKIIKIIKKKKIMCENIIARTEMQKEHEI